MGPAHDVFMPVESSRNDRVLVDDGYEARGSAASVIRLGAAAVSAFHAVFRAMEEDERVGQPTGFCDLFSNCQKNFDAQMKAYAPRAFTVMVVAGIIAPWLTLDGLRLIWELNQK